MAKSSGPARTAKTNSWTRRDPELFDRFSDLIYLQAKFFEYVNRYKFPKKEKTMIRKAFDFSELAHRGQQRDEGSPYITHPIRVANLLMHEVADMRSDLICSALLHDVIEDCDISVKELKNNFNETIAEMVRILTKDLRHPNHKKLYYEVILVAPDPVKLVKMCDRLDNLRSLRFIGNKSKIKRYVNDSEKRYLPIAESVHLYLFREMKHEIQALKNRMR